MASLLIPESPLQVLPTLVMKIGLNEAIVVQQLFYLLDRPGNGRDIDGKRWIFNTYEQWRETYFPWWSVRTLERLFDRLENMGLLLHCQPEGRTSRRKFYRLDNEAVNLMLSGDVPDAAKMAGSEEEDCRCRQNGGMDGDKLAGSDAAKMAGSLGTQITSKTSSKTTSSQEELISNHDTRLSTPPTHSAAPSPAPAALPFGILDHMPEKFGRSDNFAEAWEGFCDHRAAMKKPMTERAAKVIALKLADYGIGGSIKALNASVENGWQGIFPPKANDDGNGRPRLSEPVEVRLGDSDEFHLEAVTPQLSKPVRCTL